MAKRDREKAGSRRRTKRAKILLFKFKKRKNHQANTIAKIVGIIGLVWVITPKEEDKGDSRKTLPTVVVMRDQVYMGFIVYWYKKSLQYACT